MIAYKCDLCGEVRECLQKEIDQREFDVCAECWATLEAKLKGKGRPKQTARPVVLPDQRILKEGEEERKKPLPGEPPTIWGKKAN
ncbi:MAG: hypothetical protein WBC04_25680 [Candidatus Acidiferrales bacterium]